MLCGTCGSLDRPRQEVAEERAPGQTARQSPCDGNRGTCHPRTEATRRLRGGPRSARQPGRRYELEETSTVFVGERRRRTPTGRQLSTSSRKGTGVPPLRLQRVRWGGREGGPPVGRAQQWEETAVSRAADFPPPTPCYSASPFPLSPSFFLYPHLASLPSSTSPPSPPPPSPPSLIYVFHTPFTLRPPPRTPPPTSSSF